MRHGAAEVRGAELERARRIGERLGLVAKDGRDAVYLVEPAPGSSPRGRLYVGVSYEMLGDPYLDVEAYAAARIEEIRTAAA